MAWIGRATGRVFPVRNRRPLDAGVSGQRNCEITSSLMVEPVRTFLAIELPEEVRSALGELAERVDRAGLRGLRLVRPENTHLTLKFLGAVPPSAIEPIRNAVASVARRHRPFLLELGQAGVFPPRGAPRVLWLGVQGGLHPLALLHGEVEEALGELGYPKDEREFHPHLTVARFKEGSAPDDRRKAREELLSVGRIAGHIDVAALNLMSSTPMRQGPTYRRMASIRLGSGPGPQDPV